MDRSELTVRLEVSWGDARTGATVQFDAHGTSVTVLHEPKVGQRQRMLAIVNPLVTALQRIPELQPSMEVADDDTPF